jgi:hypothetical protein
MGWIGFIRCEQFRCDFVARTCALTAPAQPVLHQNLCSNKTVHLADELLPSTPFRVAVGTHPSVRPSFRQGDQ